jgi:replicative DNA helicase
LKALAKELGVPVVALCQLNREADGAEPRLSHLRESGAIEQDADIVLFLHRDDADKTAATLIVAKHRHGDTGKIRLRWVPERTRFEDN